MNRATGAVAFFVSLLLPLAFGAVPAQAATHHWYGKVTKVKDGDTIYVKIKGDGLKRAVPIRNSGIQATETSPKAECHSTAAKSYLRSLLPRGTKVRLSAKHKNSKAGKDGKGRVRYWRYVDKWVPSSRSYVDVQKLMLKHGDVMWLSHTSESARLGSYHKYMQEGAAKRIGLFDSNYCGAGPSDSANLRMWLHYEADGLDSENTNGEWMRIQNRGSGDVSLSGWHLRTASHKFHRGTYYTFPAGAVVPAGDFITMFFGSGTTDLAGGRIYLGLKNTSYLPNISNPREGYPGKTIYLQDPQYDFRFMADYPCLASCAAPPAVEISDVEMKTGDGEYVDLRVKAGHSSADLSGVVVVNDGWTKEITPGTILHSGESLRVWCDKAGTNSRLAQYWGARSGTMLEDAGDTVVIRTAQSQVIDTFKWGHG